MSEKIKYILAGAVILMLALLFVQQCRFDRQLRRVQDTVDSSREAVAELGDGLRQQEQTIDRLRDITDRFSESVERADKILERTETIYRDLANTEQRVDGWTGAIGGSINNALEGIELTINGLKSESNH